MLQSTSRRPCNMLSFVLTAALLCAAAAGARQPDSTTLLGDAAPAPSPGDGTNAACCAKLAAINFKTVLPVVIVDTRGANVTRTAADSELCTCSHGLEKGDLKAKVGFRIRGGTNSQLRNKVFQYAVDLDDKKWFLGMPKSKKWMLYAQQLDSFGLHNWLGFNLTRATGRYAARTQFCELFIIDDGEPLNSKQHYRGIYLGMEKVRQEASRVNISDNSNPKDITGGYMMQYKHSQNPDNLPTVNGSVTDKQWNVEFPKPENITAAQVQYLQNYLDSFEEALYSPAFADPAKGWRQFADESAWVDWFLAVELIRNVKHTYHSAAWLTKDAGKKFTMGPVWDNVQGFGTCCGYPVKGYNDGGNTPINPASGGNGITPSGWVFTVCLNDYCPKLDTYAPGYGISTWFQQLWKDPTWVAACAKRYKELRAGPWSTPIVTATIKSVQPRLDAAAVRTLARWEKELRQAQYYPTAEAQFQSTVQQLLQWTTQRLEWLDFAFKQAVTPGKVQGPYPAAYPGMTTTPPAAPAPADAQQAADAADDSSAAGDSLAGK